MNKFEKMLKIGIPTNLRDERFGTHGNYIQWVAQFGQPILLTPRVDQYDQFDVLFLPGGKDVITEFGNTVPSFLNNPSDPHLQWFDREYIIKSFNDEKPIFGICRGMQAINVRFGGTLRNLYGKALLDSTKWNNEEEKLKRSESIEILDSRFYQDGNFANDYDDVNSLHHQVIDKLANNFEIIAKSEKYKHPEAIIHKDGKVAGVQWHPEKINDGLAKDIFNFILR